MIVVDQPAANQVLIVLDVFVKAGELYHLHDDKAGEQGDDKQGWVDAALHHDLIRRGRWGKERKERERKDYQSVLLRFFITIRFSQAFMVIWLLWEKCA